MEVMAACTFCFVKKSSGVSNLNLAQQILHVLSGQLLAE
jgi:hypothetical protein